MILTDTSIVIDWLHRPSLQVRQIIAAHAPVICGVTVAEVLVGVRSEGDREKVMRQMGIFGRVAVDEPVWEIAGRIGGALEARGSRIPFQDLVVISTSIHHGIPVWTRDAHFSRVLDVAPELALFDESTA